MGNTKRVNTVKITFHSNNIHGFVCTWHSGPLLSNLVPAGRGGGGRAETERNWITAQSLSGRRCFFSAHLITGEKSFETPLHTKKYVLTHRLLYWSIKKTFPKQSKPILEFVFQGSLYVSGKLPTYPSPKPTLTLTSHLGQNDGLGEG